LNEYYGQILRDEIDTRHLLENLEDECQNNTVEVSVVAHAEDVLVASLRHFDNSILNRQKLLASLDSIGLVVVERGEHLQSLVLTASQDEPPGRLRHEGHEHVDHQSENELDGDRYTPCRGAASDKRESESDPVAEGQAGSYTCAGRHHEQGTSSMRLRALCLPCWDGRSVEAIAKASNDPAGDELTVRERCRLDDLADDQECRAHIYGVLAADQVTPKDSDHGRQKTADIPCRYGHTLNHCDMLTAWVANGIDLWELSAEFGYGE